LGLYNEISARHAQITELEQQLAQVSSERRALSESQRTQQEHLDDSEKRGMEFESELAAARERLALLEDEKPAQLGKVEASFAEASAERSQLAAALDQSRERRQVDKAFDETARLSRALTESETALTATRAATAERLLSEARQNLIFRTEEVRAFDRKSVEATIARNGAEKRLTQIEAMQEARERHIKDLERARAALTEHDNAMVKTLKAREAALVRAEEKIAMFTERNGRLDADIRISRTNIETRGRGTQLDAATRAHGSRGSGRRTGSRAQGQCAAAKRDGGVALGASPPSAAR
jgi:crescentin